MASATLSSPNFLADSVEDEFELSTVCHRPEGLEQLQEQTKFTRKELQVLYRGFKNVSSPHSSGAMHPLGKVLHPVVRPRMATDGSSGDAVSPEALGGALILGFRGREP